MLQGADVHMLQMHEGSKEVQLAIAARARQFAKRSSRAALGAAVVGAAGPLANSTTTEHATPVGDLDSDSTNSSKDRSTTSEYASSLRVRNTFIDLAEVDDDEMSSAGAPRAHSSPPPHRRGDSTLVLPALQGLPASPIVREPEGLDEATGQLRTNTKLGRGPASASRTLPDDAPVNSTNVEDAHRRGECKPCAFFHTRGCRNGTSCQFCHRCSPEDYKVRAQQRWDRKRREWREWRHRERRAKRITAMETAAAVDGAGGAQGSVPQAICSMAPAQSSPGR